MSNDRSDWGRYAVVFASNIAEGLLFRSLGRSVLGLPEWLSQAIGIGTPAMIGWMAGLPVGACAAGAAAGSGIALLHEKLTQRPMRIVFFSDAHGYGQHTERLVARMLEEPGVDAFVYGGDAEDWESFSRYMRPIRATGKPFYGVPGNHDTLDDFESYFGHELPLRVPAGTGALWLVGDLARLSTINRIVQRDKYTKPLVLVVHRSPIGFSDVYQSTAGRIRVAMEPALSRGCIVLSGHEHVWGWGAVGKANVVTAGIAGSKHYECGTSPLARECDANVRGFCVIEIGETVDVRLVRTGG